MEQSDVFISYRRKDVDFVKRIDQALKATGREVWVDWEDIPPGVEGFADEIQRGIEGADAFIAVLSPAYLESEYCLMELREALRLKKRIVPVIYQKFDPAPPPEGIGHINWVYFTPHAGQENTFEQSFPKVIEALEADYEYNREHTRVLLRAIDWDKNERNRSYLLKGVEIDKAESWQVQTAGKNLAPTELQTDLIITSRKVQRQQQRQFMAVIGGLLVVAVIAAIYAVFQARAASINAEVAHSRALASAALQPGNEEIAVALALEATRGQHASPEAFKALAQAAYPSGGIRYLLEPDPQETYFDYRYPAISPDGQFVAIKDKLYDLAAGALLRTFEDAPGYVLAGAFTPGGDQLILAGDDDGVLDPQADPVFMGMYDAGSGELLWSFDTGIGVMDIHLSADGSTLVGFQPDGKAVWWDTGSAQKLGEFPYEGKLAFSPDMRWVAELVQPEEDELTLELTVYDTDTLEVQSTAEIAIDDWYDYDEALLRFSPDSEWLTVSAQTLDTFDVESGELVSFLSDIPSGILSLRYSPDGSKLVIASSTHGVTLWETAGPLQAEQKAHRSWAIFADFTQDGDQVISTDISGTVIAWDVFPGNVAIRNSGMDWEQPVALTAGGSYLLTEAFIEADNLYYAVIRDAATLEEVSRLPLARSHEYYSPLSAYLAQGLENGLIAYQTWSWTDGDFPAYEISIASLANGEVLQRMDVPGFEALRFLQDGETVLLHFHDGQDHLEIRSISTGEILYADEWDTFALSPDGTRLWLGGSVYDETDSLVSRPTMMMDMSEGTSLFSVDDPAIDSVFFTPDGTQFVSATSNAFGGSSQQMYVQDAAIGEVLRSFTITTQSGTYVFHPSGSTFFTGVPLGGSGGSTEFPSGFELPLAAENTGAIRQWDFQTGDLLWEFPTQTGNLLVTPDGSRLITGDYEDLRAWRLDTHDQMVAWACANRYIPEFTLEQRERFGIESEDSLCNSR